MATQTDVERAIEALTRKQAPYASLYDYYNGRQPLQYAAALLAKVFRNLDAKWTENWCAVVIDSLLERLELAGFACKDAGVKDALDALWHTQDLALDAARLHKSVAITGEGYLLVEQEQADGGGKATARIYANRPHLCHAFYEEQNPKELEFAAKWWEERAETHLTLYYPDHFEHYLAPGKRTMVTVADNFTPDPDLPEEANPWSRIPLFHFTPDPDRVHGELTNVIPLNNAINKLFADMMVSAEFGAFKQRFIVSNADTAKLINGPNELWSIPAGDKEEESTQIGAFEATDLSNYIDAMNDIANKIAVITRTPKHYLLQAGDVSGEALLAMEAPLVKKAQKYEERLTVGWRATLAFALELTGIQVDQRDIEPTWEEERTVQPYTEALTRKTNVDAGVPLVTQLRMEGWSDAELEQLAEDQDAEQSRTTKLADVAIQAAKKAFDQGQTPSPYPGQPVAPADSGAPQPPLPVR